MSARPWYSQATNSIRALAGRPETVHAHCDIPCGIYDPHEAQIAALTVIRMDQLIAEAGAPAAGAKPEELSAYQSKIARYTAVKEQHAEKAKHEIRVIFGDYFTADLLKAHPQTADLVFRIYKQASKARQGTNVEDAQELLKQVQEFAELFWKTKSVATHRLPSHQKPGGELVVPAA
ncbi:MAG: superoxide dismutase, Ni [Thermoplasmata archaeon]